MPTAPIGLAVERDRRRDVGQLLVGQLRPIGGPMQEHRLAADARDDNRLAGLHDLAGDALAEAVTDPLALGNGAGRGFELDLAASPR